MLKSLLRLTRPLASLALLAAALSWTLPARADGLSDLESFLRQARQGPDHRRRGKNWQEPAGECDVPQARAEATERVSGHHHSGRRGRQQRRRGRR